MSLATHSCVFAACVDHIDCAAFERCAYEREGPTEPLVHNDLALVLLQGMARFAQVVKWSTAERSGSRAH
jgi:hypothetical protein